MSNVFEQARTITALEVAERYAGITPTRKGTRYVCNCPFPDHPDRNPSFSFDTAGKWAGGFICSCGRHGADGTAFLSQYKGIAPIEAARTICADFGLAVGDSAPSAKEIQKRNRLKEARESIGVRASFVHAVYCSWKRWCEDRMDEIDPNDDTDTMSAWLDTLINDRNNAVNLIDAIEKLQRDGKEGNLYALLNEVYADAVERYKDLAEYDKTQGTHYVSGVRL